MPSGQAVVELGVELNDVQPVGNRGDTWMYLGCRMMPTNKRSLLKDRLGMAGLKSLSLRGIRAKMAERRNSERGASMVEYALLVGLIAVVAVVAVVALGGSVSGVFTSANSALPGSASGGDSGTLIYANYNPACPPTWTFVRDDTGAGSPGWVVCSQPAS